MADSRYAGEAGLQAVFGQIKAAIAEKQDKINGMGLSHNDYSDAEKQKNAQNASDIYVMQNSLTNLTNDVKLNTNDLTTSSRTKNIAASVFSTDSTIQYATALYVDCKIEPSTTYTLSFNGTDGNKLYTNENIFVQQKIITVGSGRTSVTVTTKAIIPSSEYTDGKGWRFLKNHIEQPNNNAFTDVQLELGSTATPYVTYIPSVESRLEAADFGILPNAVNYLPSVTIDACQLWKNGKVVNGNIKFTTSETIASGNFIISGLPIISTSAVNGSAMGAVSFNKNGAFGALANTSDGTYGAIFVTAELVAGTYCASFSYISV